MVDDSVAWISGSKGWVGKSTDGGNTWKFARPVGYEQCDFRSIYAIDANTAIIANAGAPAYILRTTDGGSTWQKLYENHDTSAFIDGIDMQGKKGIVYGDPIAGHMLMLHTTDGGVTWKEYPYADRPLLCSGEASFAASGTCIRYFGRRRVLIATGGKVSRLFLSRNGGKSWRSIGTPILQGMSGTGIFSVLPLGRKHWVIAGGNYMQDTLRTANLFYTYDAGGHWRTPRITTRGYRECLAAISSRSILAVGPAGIDISHDDGDTWTPFSDEKQLHVARRARKGALTILAGGNGKIYILPVLDN
ncbi:oxidoreductase [Nemorincola caseinilytica]|uniref:Oxidoreductase n=1 Tax=Nemorincola caseinilytica TaxID=2054315 RepID=A0ABP8N5P9_9BACT